MDMFAASELDIVNNSVAVAEEIVCNFYKMSASQWLRHRYDVNTLAELAHEEIVEGPFAQIIRYEARKEGNSLGSSVYDFYKICLQDNTILATVGSTPGLDLFPFTLYVIVHELSHIVRFARFHQNFEASPEETAREEERVHQVTRLMLERYDWDGMDRVLQFYAE